MIQFFNTTIRPKSIELVTQVLKSGFLNQGPMVKQFESKLSEFGLLNPITVNSCTSALHMALECIEAKGEVILPAQSFIATGLAVLMAGCTPKFVDIELDGNISVKAIENAITDKTSAIIMVHWGGNPCKIHEIQNIAYKNNIYTIEDCAHAFGAHYKNELVGNLSDFSCFSFQSLKLLSTGDGGCICCRDVSNIHLLKAMRWFGINKDLMKRTYEGDRDCNVYRLGFKYHMNDINASIGIGELEYIPMKLQARQWVASLYNKNLKDVPGLTIIKTDHKPSYWLYTILVENRVGFIKKMRENNIPTSVVDRRIDKHDIFGGPFDLPNQAYFDEHQISIPIHEALTLDDINHIIKTIKSGW